MASIHLRSFLRVDGVVLHRVRCKDRFQKLQLKTTMCWGGQFQEARDNEGVGVAFLDFLGLAPQAMTMKRAGGIDTLFGLDLDSQMTYGCREKSESAGDRGKIEAPVSRTTVRGEVASRTLLVDARKALLRTCTHLMSYRKQHLQEVATAVTWLVQRDNNQIE